MSLAFLARRFDTREPVRVRIDAGKIVRVEPAADDAAQSAALPWVAPGFVDIQVNGWKGQEFSALDLTPEKVLAVTREHYPFGVTGYCPTLTTQSLDCLAHGVATIHQACQTLPEVVKSMVRAKTPERIVLVSDVSGLGGLPVGRYAMTSGVELEILPSGKLVVAGQDQILAGASLPIGFGVANVMQFAGVDLATAVTMASTRPAEIIGAPHGGLRPGDRADLVLFTLTGEPASLNVNATIAQGDVIYGKLPA